MTPHNSQQEQQRCDGDCLSCDVETYVSCDKRINPEKHAKSPFDKLIKWKHDYIRMHGYYPTINDVWSEVEKIRESDKRCASHSSHPHTPAAPHYNDIIGETAATIRNQTLGKVEEALKNSNAIHWTDIDLIMYSLRSAP